MDVDMEATAQADLFVIRATDVPQVFFQKRDAAKKYFRSFGKVKLTWFKPKRKALVVEYDDENGMLNALELAGEYNGHVFKITRDFTTTRSKKRPKNDPDPDWMDDPDVKAELEAMGGLAPRTFDLRSDAMIVDSNVSRTKQRKWASASPKPKPKPKKKQNAWSQEESELTNVLKQQALSSEDKFKILDARDKLIRIRLKKSTELSKASATVGACPDMCPEKERLMREYQHQVALYEQEEGERGMNARLAVKQYSRSSADQEAPLPQELRPVGVLQMTMGYLMHRITDLCDVADVNVAEWYHFLWDRTRGIRKDITQQALCCQGSVELVEQCARFHIFCSARLVSEDPSVFDQKINTENLTKCLQTLKYMYHDLQVKGERCENEGEFRAYIILLNLNDGNFMWEVQKLRREIQQSEPVKFALEVHSSLDKNNYVKFFKLVSSTTFLNACIVMRYFIQVRRSAIKTLLKSYSPRVSQTSLPVSYVTKILAFESTESTIEFFETYGLYTDVERNRIVLDKPNFTDPEYPYVLDRAVHLVESKRHLSVGQVICGKELPPKIFEKHLPYDSFNADGYLISAQEIDETDSIIKKVDRDITAETEKATESVVSSSPATEVSQDAPPKVVQSSQDIFAKQAQHTNDVLRKSFSDKSIRAKPQKQEVQVSTQKSFWSGPVITQESFFKQTDKKHIFGGDIVPLVPPGQLTETEHITPPPKPTIEREKIDELNRRKAKEKEEEELKRRIEEQKVAELKKQLLLEQQERRRKAAELKKQILEERKRKENEKYQEIKRGVNETIDLLLNTVESHIKEQTLTEISQRIQERKLKSVISKWRENTRRKRKRKAIDFNPPWFGSSTVREGADELQINSQDLALYNIKRYRRGHSYDIPLSDNDVDKIDLCELTHELLCKKFLEVDAKLRQELFWKVTVSVPSESEFDCGLNHVERILQQCFQWKEKTSGAVLIEQSKSSPTITYCLEKQKGLVVNKRNDTNGFIFIANDLNDDLHRRIAHNFKNYGVFVKIPIVLVLQNYDGHKSKLKGWLEEGIISDYLIIVDKFSSKNLSNVLEEALVFLSTRVEKSPPLEMDALKSFLLKYLCSDLWKRAKSFTKWNSTYKNCLRDPTTVICLYNEAVRRLKVILLDETSKEHPKFPDIFKDCLRSEIPDSLPCDYKYFPSFWDQPSYLGRVKQLLDGLALPNFLENWPPTNQVQMESGVSKYCAGITQQPQTLFYKTMSVLLRDVDPTCNFRDVCDVVWIDVIELFAEEKINQTDFSLYGTGFVNKSLYNQIIVVYDIDNLAEYEKSDWFYINNPAIKHKIFHQLQEESSKEICSTKNEFEDLDVDTIFRKIQEPRKQNVAIKNELSSCKSLIDDLESSVVIHKKILEKSRHLLETILKQQ